MIRFLISIVINLAAAAVGLIVASLVLDDFTITASGFLITVVVFGVLQGVLGPFIARTAHRNAPALMGGIGLVTTFVALLITDLVTDGLSIKGTQTWILATLIVWLASLIAILLIPLILVKMGVESARKRRD
jgi:Mycobacterial 4 TMS phage holin, superfamily IV